MAIRSATFLAANSAKGFISFFDELYNPYKNTSAYIIKGGPGTGKSTFMRKLAEEFDKRGYSTERVYCSSDPDSLDALIVPETGFSICDGTQPHIVEPSFPGAVENFINLGAFWDEKKLRKNADEIRRLFFENSLYHRKSSGYLAAAGQLEMQNRKIAAAYIKRDKIDSYASRFIYRELSGEKRETPGEKRKRFLSAISPKGNIFLSDTIRSLCPRAVGIEDRDGVAAALIAERIGEAAVGRGYDTIFCYCPLRAGETEHILVPEKGVAFVRLAFASAEVECDRVIHTGRFMKDGFSRNRSAMRFNIRLKNELVKESILCLKKAKELHDKLEEIYIDAMDFERLDEFRREFIEGLFS